MGNYNSKKKNFRKGGKYNEDSEKDSRYGKKECADTSARVRPNIRQSRSNDAGWYSKDANLLAAAGSFPYGAPLGNRIGYTNSHLTTENVFSDDSYIPGIMTLALVTSPGVGSSDTSPVNIAARNIYSFVRHANSGKSNYDSPDLMLYLLAVDEALMMFYHGKRAYGAVHLYNNENRYFPKMALGALGFDYDDVITNYAQFHYALNAIAARISSLVVPNTMSLFARHKWLYEGLYLDGTSPKAQAYAFVPEGYRTYNDTAATGGNLNFWSLRNELDPRIPRTTLKKLKVSEWIAIMNALINPLLSSEDIGIMSGDILKAYGSSGLVTVDPVPMDYTITPVYDEEVLSQFQNAIAVGYPGTKTGDLTSLNIAQDPGVGKGQIIFNPSFYSYTKLAGMTRALGRNMMINLNLQAPTVADTVVASRLMAFATGDLTLDGTVVLFAGSEICTTLNLYTFRESTTVGSALPEELIQTFFFDEPVVRLKTDTADSLAPKFVDIISMTTKLSRFKFHPAVVVNYFGEASGTNRQRTYWEIDNYAMVDGEHMGHLHEACLLSEFDVPANYSAQKY